MQAIPRFRRSCSVSRLMLRQLSSPWQSGLSQIGPANVASATLRCHSSASLGSPCFLGPIPQVRDMQGYSWAPWAFTPRSRTRFPGPVTTQRVRISMIVGGTMANGDRCVQARCHARYCHWLGQPERRGIIQHLPRRRRASVLSGSRGGAGIFSAVPIWWITRAVCSPPAGERETPSGRPRPLDSRTGETGDREAWRQAARLYIHAVAVPESIYIFTLHNL